MWGRTNSVIRYRKNLTVYQQIQKLVRQGKVQEHYVLGDIIPVSGIEWQVVAFDVATPADASLTHSMTLCTKDCVDSLQFDNREASNPNSDRKIYGNNRYAHSAIRQWLNSDKPAGEWWTSQHQYDTAPDYATTKDGFMKALAPDFLAVIGKTKIRAGKCMYDDGSYDVLEDYFYLPSMKELGYESAYSDHIVDGVNFPYFSSDATRKKRYNSNYCAYFCRTSYYHTSSHVCCIDSNGKGDLTYRYSNDNCGVPVVCNII